MRALLVVLILSTASVADEEPSRGDMPQSFPEIALEEGWRIGSDVGFHIDWDYNQYRTGMETGHFLRLGGSLKLTATFLSEDHELRNKIIFAQMVNKSPNLDWLVKSNDRLAFEGMWLWGFGGWWGTVAQGSLDTSVFSGNDFQVAGATYNVADINGAVTSFPNVTAFRLTDPLKPLYLREALGFFARPLNSVTLTWEARITGYALQGFVNAQKQITGQDTNGISVQTLADFYQVGPSIGSSFFGEILPKMFFYQINADAGYSAFESSARAVGPNFFDRVIFNGTAALTFKPADFVALTWEVHSAYIPEVSPSFEIDNQLFLSFPFST